MDFQKLKDNAVTSATYDTALQAGLRVVSFVLNAFIVRQVSHEVFAVMTVRLHLLYATGLLLSREAFRRAAHSAKDMREIHRLVNLIWIGSFISIPVSIGGFLIWTYVMEVPPESITSFYGSGVVLMSLCVVLEVTAEVPFVIAELQLWVKTRVLIEGSVQVLRSVLLAVFVYMWPSWSVLLYGVAQLSGSALHVAAYYGLFWRAVRGKKMEGLPISHFSQLFPRWSSGSWLPDVNTELASLVWSFFQQGWLKEALTEGEWYLMSVFPLISLAQQGVYHVVSNLGSLVARLVFRSVETASYKYFAQTVVRGKLMIDQDQERVVNVTNILSTVLRSLLLVSLLIVTFGWSYSGTFLQLYGGSSLREEGSSLMQCQCIFVVFLAMNGITEAFTFAVMDARQLKQYNWLLVAFTMVYMTASVVFTMLFGAVGFVFSNCTNMALRIVYSFWFIQRLYKGTEYSPVKSLQIPFSALVAFIVVYFITSTSEAMVYPISVFLHLIIGMLCFTAIAFHLRFELQLFYEQIFQLLDRLVMKLTGNGSTLKTGVVYHTPILNWIHMYFFRVPLKLVPSKAR